MSRIYQYPVVTEISSDDYLALGSVNGSRSILASNLAPVIGNKTITERGTYKASDDNMDGYGQVTVDIPYTDIHVASGDIATFEGEDLPLKSLKVAVTPYQDLHGYDSPWAGGAGKNKFPDGTISFTRSKTYSCKLEAGTYTLSALVTSTDTDATTCLFVVRNSNNQSLDNGRLYRDTRSSATFTITEQADNIIFYASDSNAHSTDDTATWTDVQVEIGSTATTFAPYSNICPISGWDEANVTRCGKNLLGGLTLGNAIVEAVNNPSNTYLGTDADGNYVTFLAGAAIREKDFSSNLKFKEKTRYSFVLALKRDASSSQSIATNLQVIYTDGTVAQITFPSQPTLGVKTTFVFTTDTDKTVKEFSLGYYSGRIYMYYEECGIFEGVITTDDFAPYNGATYTIDLNGTRYGSELDVLNGVDTDTLGSVDLGTLNWTRVSEGDFYTFRYSTFTQGKRGRMEMLCSNYGSWYGSRVTVPNGYICKGNLSDSVTLCVRDDSYTDEAEFKTAMSGVQLVYELATPITVQLSPTQVKSLVGTNNIFANCGAVDVEYQTVWVRPSN